MNENQKIPTPRGLVISKDLYDEVAEIAREYMKTPDDMAECLINAQVDYYQRNKRNLFFPGLEWINPKKPDVVIAAVLDRDMEKLSAWTKAGDWLETLIYGKNEVCITHHKKGQEPAPENTPLTLTSHTPE